jgi:dipeptidase E
MIILSSGGFNEKLFSFCKENILKNYTTINSCIIPTAAKTPDLKRDSEKGSREYLLNKSIENIDIFDFEYNDNIDLLYKYNFIIINGGNPFNLLYHVKRTGAESILLEIGNTNKIIIGISAGALLFSHGVQYIEEWYDLMGFPKSHGNIIGLKDLSGIKYKDIIIFPHYDSFLKQNKNLENELKNIEERDRISIYRMMDDKSIYFKKGKMIEI